MKKDFEIIRSNSMNIEKEIVVLYGLIALSYSLKPIKTKFACGLLLNIIIFRYNCFHVSNDKIIYVFKL